MIKSKLTRKARTMIPLPIRTALCLATGDDLAYRIEGDRVIVTQAAQGVVHDPFARFDEWDSEADRFGYAGL
jgi:antitoxin PrlF